MFFLYDKLILNFTFKKLKYIILIITFSPLIVLLLILRPLILFRFGKLDIERIGIISSLEDFLLHKRQKNKTANTFDIWVYEGSKFNKQFYIILKRKFIIIKQFYYLYQILVLFSKYTNFFSDHILNFYNKTARIDRAKPILNLSKEEIKKGEINLKNFGVPSNAKIVCFTCRDSTFLKKQYPKQNFSYHNYRDSNIKNYIPAIKMLIKKNFYVIRMGRSVKNKIKIKNKKFIDYPFHPLKNDLMDFFLAYKCYFWIAGCSGVDDIAVTFRKPMIDLNMAPISGLKITSKKTLLCSKIYMNKKNQKLSLNDIFKNGIEEIDRTEGFEKKKIKLYDLNSKQIKDIVLDMLNLMSKSWKISKIKDIKLQKKFKHIFLQNIDQIDPKFNYKFNALYGLSFLKKNTWFLK